MHGLGLGRLGRQYLAVNRRDEWMLSLPRRGQEGARAPGSGLRQGLPSMTASSSLQDADLQLAAAVARASN